MPTGRDGGWLGREIQDAGGLLPVPTCRLCSWCCCCCLQPPPAAPRLFAIQQTACAPPEASCNLPGSSKPAAPADPWGCVHAQNRAGGAEISASVGQRSCGTQIDEVSANDER